MDEGSRVSRTEHAKFLIFQIKENLERRKIGEESILQCSDGSLPVPTLLLGGLSDFFNGVLDSINQEQDPVIILPNLQMGEVLLFLKYLLAVNVKTFYAREDVAIIKKVGAYFQLDFDVSCPRVRREIKKAKETLKKLPEKLAAEKERRLAEKQKEGNDLNCPFCEVQVDISVMSKHMRKSHPELEYACLECHENLSSRETLDNHIQEHPDSQWFRSCHICSFVCTSLYQLEMHRKSHSIAEKGSKKCKFCDKEFLKDSYLKKHEEQHELGKFNKTYPCVQCNKTFSKQSNLARHIRSHFGVKLYACEDCPATFVDSTRLKEHRWIHLDYAKFKCPLEDCTQAFRHRSNLKNHISTAHHETQKFPCPQCNKQFAFQYKLRNHLRWHEMEEEMKKKEKVEETVTEFKDSSVYVCSSCKREFKSIDDLGVHCKEFHPPTKEPSAKKRKLEGTKKISMPDLGGSEAGAAAARQSQGDPQHQPPHDTSQLILTALQEVVGGDELSGLEGGQEEGGAGSTQGIRMELERPLQLDAETKQHLQTLDDIRLESPDVEISAEQLSYLNNIFQQQQQPGEMNGSRKEITLAEHMRVDEAGNIILEVSPKDLEWPPA